MEKIITVKYENAGNEDNFIFSPREMNYVWKPLCDITSVKFQTKQIDYKRIARGHFTKARRFLL